MTRSTTVRDLAPKYDPAAIESAVYQRWVDAGVFTADRSSDKEPYVIVIPPPNVTDVLHMGHGLNNTLQDVMIRFERMRGREALWLPGTDHAGIATQNVVERQLREEGKTRQELGREAFVERVWDHVHRTGETILDQLKAIGASCDWSRTRFTMDEDYSAAVKRVFVQLHKDGLVYRGHRVIHWCPRCLTSLSDEPTAKSADVEIELPGGRILFEHFQQVVLETLVSLRGFFIVRGLKPAYRAFDTILVDVAQQSPGH